MINRKITRLNEATPKRIKTPAPNLDSRVTQIEQVLDNMALDHGTGIMLAGPTGIGKTTFVQQLGKLLGMKVVLIEAPHVTEEHLINIPFVVFEANTTKGKPASVNLDKEKWTVQLAQSHLAAELHRTTIVPDNSLISEIRSSSANLRAIWQKMGGSESVIPPEIAQLRDNYRVILFLDEYYRQTSANVRNILRGILNRKIGNDKMPPGVYVIYATNLTDVGQTIEAIPTNNDFKKINFKPPTQEQFFHYLVSKFEKDTQTALKPEVVDAFKKVISDSHVSFDDAATEIRTSPRRWEQVVLYVNANVPVTTAEQAAALLSSVRSMFQFDNEVSSLHSLTEAAVRNIIADTGAEHLKDVKALSTSDWRDTLLHQIQTKIKLGDARSYVPIVAGQPGIGKTAQAADVAQKLNMLLIDVACDTLSVDEITGIPIPQKDGHKMNVQFSEPSLYLRIMQDIKEDTEAFMNDPSISDERKQAFLKQPYKYLIFFDEFNRPKSANVFNSLRRVILEKSFNDQVKLPEGSIVIAAMNPHDKGTVELTGHIRDSTDYIDTAPSWKMTKNYLEHVVVNMPRVAKLHQQAKQVGLDIVLNFVNQFSVKKSFDNVTGDNRQFYIKIGSDVVYISPRELTTMLLDLIKGIDRTVGRAGGMTAEQYSAALADAAWWKISSTLEWIMDKHQVNSPQFLNMVENWLQQLCQKYLVKTRQAAAFEDMIDTVMADHSKHLKDDVDFVNYAQNFSRNKFAEDLENYVEKMINQAAHPIEVIRKKWPDKTLAEKERSIAKNLISQFEYLENELMVAAETFNLSNDLVDEINNIRFNLGTKLQSLITADEHWNELFQFMNDQSEKMKKGQLS